jgi:hypothetical protein
MDMMVLRRMEGIGMEAAALLLRMEIDMVVVVVLLLHKMETDMAVLLQVVEIIGLELNLREVTIDLVPHHHHNNKEVIISSEHHLDE